MTDYLNSNCGDWGFKGAICRYLRIHQRDIFEQTANEQTAYEACSSASPRLEKLSLGAVQSSRANTPLAVWLAARLVELTAATVADV